MGPEGVYGINKAIAAVLVAGIVFFLSGTIGALLVHEKPLKQTAIKIAVPEAASPAGQPAAPEVAPIAPLARQGRSGNWRGGH